MQQLCNSLFELVGADDLVMLQVLKFSSCKVFPEPRPNCFNWTEITAVWSKPDSNQSMTFVLVVYLEESFIVKPDLQPLAPTVCFRGSSLESRYMFSPLFFCHLWRFGPKLECKSTMDTEAAPQRHLLTQLHSILSQTKSESITAVGKHGRTKCTEAVGSATFPLLCNSFHCVQQESTC